MILYYIQSTGAGGSCSPKQYASSKVTHHSQDYCLATLSNYDISSATGVSSYLLSQIERGTVNSDK